MNSRTVSVLGLGNWGTALAHHLAGNGLSVIGWSIDAVIVESVNKERRNPHYLSDIALHASLRATMSLEEALAASYLVLAFPSAALGEIVPRLSTGYSGTVISAIKGIESGTLLTPTAYCRSVLGDTSKVAVLSGPSFAKDVVRRSPVGIVLASADPNVRREAAALFSSETMRVYQSSDWLGVEIGGVVKNTIALAAGCCDGLGFGESARAGLITRGLAEMMRLAKEMGGDTRTLAGLSGLGDLAMTATSDASRNRTVGLRLGRGESLDQILCTLGSVAEAVESTAHVVRLAEKYGVDMPISRAVFELLQGRKTAQEIVRALLARPTGKEFED